MSVILERHPAPGSSAIDATTPAGQPVDVPAAEAFLRARVEELSEGLARADDPLLRRSVLSSHDAAHHAWLRLIAEVSCADRMVGERLTGLYAFHGCVAGALEGYDRRPRDPALRAHARRVLEERLRTSTREVVDSLRNLAA